MATASRNVAGTVRALILPVAEEFGYLLWDVEYVREGGEWFAYTTVDGKPLGKPMVDEWKCPYHNGRMCLRVMERNV